MARLFPLTQIGEATCPRCGEHQEWTETYAGYGQYDVPDSADRCQDCGWWLDDEPPTCDECGEEMAAELVPVNPEETRPERLRHRWEWYCPACREADDETQR